MKKGKIVFTIDSNLPGGAERVTSILANYFVQNDYAVTVINSDTDSSFYSFDKDIVNLKMRLDQESLSSLGRFKKKYKFLLNYFKTERPDAVITFLFHMEIPTILAALRAGVKVFTSVRNSALSYTRIERLVRRILYPRIAGVVFQSQKVMDFSDFVKVPHKTVIMNPLSVEKSAGNSVSYEERKKWIINVGRLNRQKNQKLLIDAFASIADDFPEFSLHIFGNGDLYGELSQYIVEKGLSSRIVLEGEVLNAICINKDAYAFVLSSDFEGFPNVLAEAMAYGIPSISTNFDSGVADQLIKTGENGFLFPVGDLTELTVQLRKLLELSPTQYMNIVEKEQTVQELLNVQTIGKQWEQFCMNT